MERTLYFWRSSFDSGDDIIFRRTYEGALKWRLHFLLWSEVTNGFNFMVAVCKKAAQEGQERACSEGFRGLLSKRASPQVRAL